MISNISTNKIRIGNYKIGADSPPFIIAEMSGNHNKSLKKALEIVEAAAGAGAHAIKLQTYTADTMTLDMPHGEFLISDTDNLWKGKTLHDLYQEAYTPWEWHKPIFDRCRELNIIGFSTPFDETAVEFLESLDVPCYKIASFENIDIPLIRKVAKTKKPVFLSTGMASLSELEDAVQSIRGECNEDVILLKCTSSYPATPEGSNLITIPHMRELFFANVGISDHTLGIGVAIASVALGGCVVEKHVTLSRAEGGVDAGFSMEPHELSALVNESKRAWESLGHTLYGPSKQEQPSLKYRRSLYVIRDMKAGEEITDQNLRSIRPAKGLSPKFYNLVIGKQILRDVKRGTPFTWDLII
ncbi:MAG: pseudaminic acid synthase [Candidatus Brocadiaceae bacterium]|nr:pseudaminic acid synthase [Candidatus Brocadiaceae bacterium]